MGIFCFYLKIRTLFGRLTQVKKNGPLTLIILLEKKKKINIVPGGYF